MTLRNVVAGTVMGAGLLAGYIGYHNAKSNYDIMQQNISLRVEQVWELRASVREAEFKLDSTSVSGYTLLQNSDTILYFRDLEERAGNLREQLTELESKYWVRDELQGTNELGWGIVGNGFVGILGLGFACGGGLFLLTYPRKKKKDENETYTPIRDRKA